MHNPWNVKIWIKCHLSYPFTFSEKRYGISMNTESACKYTSFRFLISSPLGWSTQKRPNEFLIFVLHQKTEIKKITTFTRGMANPLFCDGRHFIVSHQFFYVEQEDLSWINKHFRKGWNEYFIKNLKSLCDVNINSNYRHGKLLNRKNICFPWFLLHFQFYDKIFLFRSYETKPNLICPTFLIPWDAIPKSQFNIQT